MIPNPIRTPVDITDPAILIRIQRAYRHGMPADALYEATRGVWRIGPRRSAAKYAMAVFDGIIREVYEIDEWHPAASTPYMVRPLHEVQRAGRWEFTGRLALDDVRQHYIGKSVASRWERGAANPITYVHC